MTKTPQKQLEKTEKSEKLKKPIKSNSKYELLAPVGNFSMLNAAVNAGADAVYFGIKDFNMRQGARNFKIEDLDKIKEICSKGPNKVKRYLTLNTIIYDSELESLEKVVKKVKDKVDAIICWDMSVINLCNKYNIPFHISTQASVSNSKTAKFYKELGAERVILARELSLKQIKEISNNCDVILEAFVHGAMCVSVSGRCFLSGFLFNKSANRGECIHPCRRSYIVKDKQEGYEIELKNDKVLSAKDLCTLHLVEKMKKVGIKSFKIEGRSRDARYVDTVVKIYRKALDNKLSKDEIKEGMEELEKVYNRKFSNGFYLGKPGPKDFTDVEHSASKEYKHFVGKVKHYFDRLNVFTIELVSDLKIGDKISIIGDTTGIVNARVLSMEKQKKEIQLGKKGDEVGIKFSNKDISKVRKNDEVYLIKQRKEEL